MNKSFENEYRQMMKDEVPMLWDRISAALPEKNVKRFSFRKYAGAIAACICAAILIPVVLSGTRKVSRASNMRYEAEAVVSENVPFEYAAEEAPYAMDEEMFANAGNEDADAKTFEKEEAAEAKAELPVKEKDFLEKTAKKHDAWRSFKGR